MELCFYVEMLQIGYRVHKTSITRFALCCQMLNPLHSLLTYEQYFWWPFTKFHGYYNNDVTLATLNEQ